MVARSLKNRLTVLLLSVVGAVLLAAFVALDLVISSRLGQEFDNTLLTKTRALAILTIFDDGEVEFDFSDVHMSEYDEGADSEYFQSWLEDGSVFARSPSLGTRDLDASVAGSESPLYFDGALPDGRNGRFVSLRFIPQEDSEDDDDEEPEPESAPDPEDVELQAPMVHLLVARERNSLDRLLLSIHLSAALVSLLVVACIAVAVRVMVGVGLRPLDELGRQIATITPQTLGEKLPMEDGTQELQDITSRFNELLDRLHDAFQRERNFSANVAHELRTPVAEVRALAEVSIKWPDDPAMVADFLEDIRDVTQRMDRTVSSLLNIARVEKPRHNGNLEDVDPGAVVDAVWGQLVDHAGERKVFLKNEIPHAFSVRTDPDDFTAIVTNLLTNAVDYSTSGSEVTITANADKGCAGIEFRNLAADLTNADLRRMFDPFWRKDTAGTTSGHAGLGLAMVRAYTTRLQLKVRHALDTDGVLRIAVVGFPLTAGEAKPS